MIALVTCAELPEGDEDDRELPALLGGEWVRWDDPDVDWAAYELVLVRSPWDYAERAAEFLAWTDRVGDRLRNPPAVIRWNTDKRYLGELRDAGLPVVPTAFVPPDAPLPPELAAGEIVVKPTVSAGSRDTARFHAGERDGAQALADAIHRSGRTVMVQPYIPSVDERGETALLYFGGRFSHAIHKGPLLQRGAGPTEELFAAETIVPRAPTADERRVADAVVAFVAQRFGGDLTYARIDLVEGPDGAPLVLELELTEPSLFFAHAAGSAERFAAAVRAA
jgi:glutathione synthase/RimK-type ligase-like ATP-grasp enzyme